MQEVERLQRGDEGEGGWKWVRCISMWLETEDYPVLLGMLLPFVPRLFVWGTLTYPCPQDQQTWAYVCTRAHQR
jgi:hypothetical protein